MNASSRSFTLPLSITLLRALLDSTIVRWCSWANCSIAARSFAEAPYCFSNSSRVKRLPGADRGFSGLLPRTRTVTSATSSAPSVSVLVPSGAVLALPASFTYPVAADLVFTMSLSLTLMNVSKNCSKRVRDA